MWRATWCQTTILLGKGAKKSARLCRRWMQSECFASGLRGFAVVMTMMSRKNGTYPLRGLAKNSLIKEAN